MNEPSEAYPEEMLEKRQQVKSTIQSGVTAEVRGGSYAQKAMQVERGSVGANSDLLRSTTATINQLVHRQKIH